MNWTFEGTTAEPVRAVVQDGDFATTLTAAGGAETLVCAGDGVGASVEERVPLVLLRRTGKQAVFAVTIEPTKQGLGTVTTIESVSQGDMMKVKVTAGNNAEEFTMEADGSCSVKWIDGTLKADLWRAAK